MEEPLNKKQLLDNLRSVRDRYESLISGMDESQLTATTLPGGWSMKDVIAHLTAWQRRTANRLEAALKGTTPAPTEWPAHLEEIPETEPGKDGTYFVNQWIYQTYRDRPLQEILQEWRRVFQRVLDFGEALDEAALNDPQRYPWLGGYPLGMILQSSFEHYQEEHLGPLLEWLEKHPL